MPDILLYILFVFSCVFFVIMIVPLMCGVDDNTKVKKQVIGVALLAFFVSVLLFMRIKEYKTNLKYIVSESQEADLLTQKINGQIIQYFFDKDNNIRKLDGVYDNPENLTVKYHTEQYPKFISGVVTTDNHIKFYYEVVKKI